MKIGIIIAMDIEYDSMVKAIGGAEGVLGCHDIVLRKCGIGKVNAAVGTVDLINTHHPDCILSTGLAGGIDMQLNVRDIVVGKEVSYHDVWCGEGNEKGQVQGLPGRFCGNKVLLEYAVRNNPDRVHSGLICTGDQFITDPQKLQVIKSDFPDGLACDMESAAIAQVCHIFNVPFISIRVISDTPGRVDDHQQQWEDFLASMGEQSFRWICQYLSLLPENCDKAIRFVFA